MIVRALPLLVCLLAFPLTAAAASTLRIHGSNTVGETLAPALLEAWLRSEQREASGWQEQAAGERRLRAGELVVELHSHGSNTGIRDLFEGRADLAMSSRPLSTAELRDGQARGLGQLDHPAHEYVIALDGLAIIVHPDNPLRGLALDQVRNIFAGEIDNWARVGGRNQPIRVLARDDQSGTYDTFRSLVLGNSTLARGAQRFESTAELAGEVAADPAAIGFVGVGGVGQARALAISDSGTRALEPRVAEVAVEDYLLTRRLYLYMRLGAGAEADRFAQFAVSDAAQPIVERSGFVAQTIRALPMTPPDDAPAEYRDLVRGAQRLSLNLRFGTGRSLLDSRAERDLTRLVRFMRDHAQPNQRLLLMGFADASETLPYLAITLANDRVDYVSRQLVDRGVSIGRARGIGGSLPVASNDNDWGRHKNRRVEVWLSQ